MEPDDAVGVKDSDSFRFKIRFLTKLFNLVRRPMGIFPFGY